MRPVDFDDLDKKPLFVAIQLLEDRGYKRIPVQTDGSLWYLVHPDKPEEMLRLAFTVDAADALVKLCAENPGNPYLPFIHEHRRVAGSPALCVTAMERLYASSELPPEKFMTLTGMGRAAALLPEGEEEHAEAHRQMLRNDKMRTAVQAFARAVADSLRRGGETVIHYANGMDDTLPLDEQVSRNVLYRRTGGAWRPVFADPFKAGIVTDDKHHDRLHRAAAAMIARLTP
jgi:hypothetical protein